MKIKYIKIKGVDPTKRGHYFIKTKNSSFFKGDYFHSKDKIWEKTHKKDVEFWLSPVPDREEEMREMLEECRVQLEFLNDKEERGTTNNVLSRLKKLLES